MAKGVLGGMSGKSVTRADLADAVYQEVSLSRSEAAEMVGEVLQGISDTLAMGKTVTLSEFGTIAVRHQGWLVGCHPQPIWECQSRPAELLYSARQRA